MNKMKNNIYKNILWIGALFCVLLASCNHAYFPRSEKLNIDANVIEMAVGAGPRFSEAWVPITTNSGTLSIKYAENLKEKAPEAAQMIWSVDDASIVKLGKDGKLLAQKPGKTIVTMKTASGMLSKTQVIVRKIYALDFTAGKGSGVVPETAYLREGLSYELPKQEGMKPPRKGMILDAWERDGKLYAPEEKIVNIQQNMTFIAVWKLKTYLVTLSGGVAGDAAIVGAHSYFVTAGERMAQPPAPQASSKYVHSGKWIRQSTAKAWDFASEKVYEDMTLVATWLPAQTVEFLPGSGVGDNAFAHGKQYREYIVPEPIGLIPPKHMEFDVWRDYGVSPAKDYKVGEKIRVEIEKVELTAIWKPIQHEVAFDNNGGSGSFGPLSKNEASNYVLPAGDTFAAPDGFEFDDWLIGYDVYKPGDSFTIPNASTSIKPRWKKKMVTVSFVPGIGSGEMDPVKLWIKAPYATYANEFTPPYHQLFDGWKYAGKVYKDSASIPTQEKDITLEATWKYDVVYAVDHVRSYTDFSLDAEQQDKHKGESNCIRKLVLDGVRFGGSEVDLGYINTDAVTNLRKVCAANLDDDPLNLMTGFNGDISKWNVSKVTDMQNMFRGNLNFDQDLSHWQMPVLEYMASAYHGSALVPEKWGGTAANTDGYAKMPAPVKARYEAYDATNKQPANAGAARAIFDAAPGSANYVADLNTVDLSRVTSFGGAFSASFNRDVSDIDTSGAIYMSNAFSGAKAFNQDINHWDVSNVQSMLGMFQGASSFDQDLDLWDTSKVRSFYWMFDGATAFNGKVEAWDVAPSRGFTKMFQNAKSFNQPLAKWNFYKPTGFDLMFSGATSFNQPLNEWGNRVKNIPTMHSMFQNAKSFNQPLDQWDVSNVTNMRSMFEGATSFNQDLSSWDTAKVTDMCKMFKNAKSFDSPLFSDTSSNTLGYETFMGATAFNQDISSWDLSNVRTVQSMFQDAKAFNQDLSSWTLRANHVTTNYDTGASSWEASKKPAW